MIEESRSAQPVLEPLDEFVVVQPLSDETETRAGLILPASAAEAAPCRTGIVTEVGSDATGVEAATRCSIRATPATTSVSAGST